MHVLALNSGSSSLKFGLYRVDGPACTVVIDGSAEAIGRPEARIHAQDDAGATLLDEVAPLADQGAAVVRIDALIKASGVAAPDAIGHRVVHGGPSLLRHCLIDDDVVARIERAATFAPLHAPPALAVIRYARAHFRRIPQVACFDTVFHESLDQRARVLPLPRQLEADGLRRYGFHGLSCESIVAQLGERLPARTVIAHLGNGASVTAVRDGRSIDTSMGLTPTGGTMMGTRCGDLDPGVLLFLMRERRLDAAALEQMLDRGSGLLGVSGVDSDMRRLRAAAETNGDARLAIDMFCYAAAKTIAAMIVALDGLDLLVFTGGIGENDPRTRAAICDRLGWIGVSLDDGRNGATAPRIDSDGSRCAVRVVPSLEDERIAHHTRRLSDPRTTCDRA